MSESPSKILVVDLELTCWESETPPEGQRREIIEIGYCLINAQTLTREPPVSVKIRPQQSRVSEYCTALTGWTEKSLKSGQTLHDACKTLVYKRGLRRYPWFSWGAGDMTTLRSEAIHYGAEYPLSVDYTNLSVLYSVLFGKPYRTAQVDALHVLGVAPMLPAHIGANDAYNAAGILIEIIRKTRHTPEPVPAAPIFEPESVSLTQVQQAFL